MNIFRRKKVAPAYEPDVTFKMKVDQFWHWFPSVADRLADGFDDKAVSNEDEIEAVRSALDEMISGVCWCFGPAMDKIGHHLALSPEGNEDTLTLAFQWARCAPELAAWEFYPAKPGDTVEGRSIRMFDQEFLFPEMSIALKPDHENQTALLEIHHPAFKELDDSQRMILSFICLDEILGELGTENWLSNVSPTVDPLPDSFPFPELADKLDHFYQLMEWEMRKPSECWHNYSFKSPDSDLPHPQADSYSKVSIRPRFISNYFNDAEKFVDPLIKEGAAMVFLAIPSEWFPEEKAVYARADVEDAVSDALEKEFSGTCVGGGMGHVFGYCDFLIVDGKRSIEIIQKAAAALNLPQDTYISFFDSTLRNVRYSMS